MLSQSRLKAARSSVGRELSSISSLTCFSSVGSKRSHCAAAGTDWPSRAIAPVARLEGDRDDTRQRFDLQLIHNVLRLGPIPTFRLGN